MPRLVDVDERRAAIIAVTAHEIARCGLGGVTMRSVASAGGWSTGILTHWFENKHDLLMATFQARSDRSRGVIDAALATGASLLDAAVETLPLDDERMLDWRVFIAYMGEAMGQDDLGALHRRRVESFRVTLREAIAQATSTGRWRDDVDPDVEAGQLLVILNGIAVQAVIAPEAWPPAQQRAVVARYLQLLAGTPTPGNVRRTSS